MKDRYGREITGLRLSLTQRCNLSCFYCHSEGQGKSQVEMGVEEVEAIVAAAASLGIRRLKLTGGEPLLRGDIVEIVRRASRYMEDTSIATNGTHLARYALALREAGLDRINISLPSLSMGNYRLITGTTLLPQVTEGIRAASEGSFALVKINMVVLRGINEGEIEAMAEFCLRHKAVLQLIELEVAKEQVGHSLYQRYHYDLAPLEREWQRRAIKIETKEMHRRKQYLVPLGEETVAIEVVRSMHNPEFCRYCSRIRVTADGKLKPCLWSNDGLVPLSSLAGQRWDSSQVKEALVKAIMERKPYWQ